MGTATPITAIPDETGPIEQIGFDEPKQSKIEK
jgi:hypothetical protein